MSNWRVSLSDLDYGPEEEAAVLAVLRSKWLTMGDETAGFEREFAALVGCKHAISVSNGTVALQLAYLALGLGPGDEIIQPSVNFIAAANMTRAIGATPVFAEIISLDCPILDPADVERRITPRTKAVVVMHYGGYLAGNQQLKELCDRRDIALIEDACHAPGGSELIHGKQVQAGNIGQLGCFSFFSNKNLATGEGGMITTDSDQLAAAVRSLRSHGMTTVTLDRHRGHAFGYDVPRVGFNCRPTEITAALGRVQLAKLAAGNQRRRELTALYHRLLAQRVPQVLLPFAGQAQHAACHLMPVVLPEGITRENVMLSMREAGVQSSIHYRAAHTMTAYEGMLDSAGQSVRLPLSEAYSSRVLTLPLHPRLSEEQVGIVVEALAAAVSGASGQ